MERQKKVIDASVIAKWFLYETGSNNALKIKDEHINGKINIVVPEFAFIEILNALRYKKYSESDLQIVNKDLWMMQLHIEKIDEFLLNKTIEISIKHNLSIYDAVYAALAMVYGCALVTADKELLKTNNAVEL